MCYSSKDKKFFRKLNKRFEYNGHRLPLPQDPIDLNKLIKYPPADDSDKASARRVNADPRREISVVRVALLTDGSTYYDYANAHTDFLHGVSKGLEHDARIADKKNDEDN